MSMSPHDETDLLTVLYEGALEDPRWSTFLARLRRRTAAHTASLLVRPADSAAHDVTEQVVGLPAIHDTTVRHQRPGSLAALYRRAPALFHALKSGRVYTGRELLDPAAPDHVDDRLAGCEAAAPAYLRLMRVSRPDGADTWLILGRDGRDFSAATGSLLSALDAHLSIALRLSGVMERRRTGASVASAALGRLGFGWLTADARGRVIDHDERSSQMLARYGLLPDGPPGPAGEAIAATLRRAGGRAYVMRLAEEPQVDVLIVPLPREAQSHGAVAAIYVNTTDDTGASRRGDRIDTLRALFDLSRTEARLADAISRGEPIVHAAARIGITEQTARTYSKRIYAKTATSGQADLARLVLTGLAGLA